MSGGDEAERIHGYHFPDSGAAVRTAPRPTGTLEQIYARIDAETPAARLNQDLDRIEGALAKLEQAVRDAMQEEGR
ncbi:hypothetical protein [Falsiroseomonas selenitidurans]|uniref:Uncharacterized protein n=1 Tax=Falsiroseomonas selenitidurans TaxID=2716335 RepID=A0ABX1DZX7_9PROT|nr:hypothetical protein [Falsiroseomonas selenitidurans]NKC30449.1 hypothetical protein [Falsiroseomonas selenitidurans]